MEKNINSIRNKNRRKNNSISLTEEHEKELQKIKLYNDFYFEVNDGWFKILKELGEKISDYCEINEVPLPKLNQIKTKFGSLRFYYTDENNDENIRKMVTNTEMISDSICEICGDKGKNMVDFRLVITVCDKHTKDNFLTMEEHKKEMEKKRYVSKN